MTKLVNYFPIQVSKRIWLLVAARLQSKHNHQFLIEIQCQWQVDPIRLHHKK